MFRKPVTFARCFGARKRRPFAPRRACVKKNGLWDKAAAQTCQYDRLKARRSAICTQPLHRGIRGAWVNRRKCLDSKEAGGQTRTDDLLITKSITLAESLDF